MTVYIEYVIIDNLIIDYLMLKATFALTGKTCSRRRLFVCAFFGSISALIYPLLSFSQIIMVAFKIISGFLIVLLCGGFKSFKFYYVNTAIFFFYTFITGGVILGVTSILNIYPSSEFLTAIMVLPVYVVLNLLSRVKNYIFNRKKISDFCYTVKLIFKENTVESVGFLDTGNSLYDGENPVILCTEDLFFKLVGHDVFKVKLKDIAVGTVNGTCQKKTFVIDRLILYILDEPNIYNNVTVCISSGLVGCGYSVILHPHLLEETYAKNNTKTQKTS